MCVSTGSCVKPAANRVAEERPDSCNSNLPGTEKPSLLGLAGGEAAGVDSCPADATGISNTSPEHISAREWLQIGVLTWVVDRRGGCLVSEASLKKDAELMLLSVFVQRPWGLNHHSG